jgi:hypothetical protein
MVQFNWKGTWLPNLPYNENVVVEYDNVNYISNQFVPPRDITPYYDPTYWDEMLVIFNTPTPTPSVTPEVTITPTPSVTPESTPTSTPEPSVTPTPDATPPPTPSVTAEVTTTPTPTNTETPTTTPTPTASPIPITGYGYNLVVLPYAPPSSGNTIFPLFSINYPPGEGTGTTNPNTFNIDGVYWNEIDNLGSDRFGYYSGMTGTSVMSYFTQNGNTAIYSGSSTAFTYDGAPGFIAFNYNPGARPGELTLVQSASTNFVTGDTVFISYTTI